MRQRFRLLVTVSRTWDDARTIEQALALIVLAPADRKARRGRGEPQASSALRGIYAR
jgi:hypothetical protein